MPKVSIGLPVYNGERFIAEALDSVLAQTFEDYELIILDNASTDQTPEICRTYLAKDRRIRYYRNDQNIGAARNFNLAFELSIGEYFKWLADDDICAPRYLERCVEILDKDPSVVLSYPKVRLINENGNLIYVAPSCLARTESSEPQVRFHNVLMDAFWCFEVFGLIRADVLRKTSRIGTYYGSDKVLLAELSLLGRFKEIDEELFLRRCHSRQSTNLTVKEKAAWIDPLSKRVIPFQVEAFMGYLAAVQKANLSSTQQLQCCFSVTRLTLKAEKWKKLLLPGKHNYFGWRLKKRVTKEQM